RRHLRAGSACAILGASSPRRNILFLLLYLPKLKLKKDKTIKTIKTILLCLLVLNEMPDRTAIRDDGGRSKAHRDVRSETGRSNNSVKSARVKRLRAGNLFSDASLAVSWKQIC
ncbi:MAG: hypothetical protein RSG77_03545, partial [Hafnia sp.]